MQIHSWLHYSASEDGVFCKACALFAPGEVQQQKLGSLVSKPFSLWTKQSSAFNSHEKLSYHHICMMKKAAFKESCRVPTQNVATMLSNAHKEQVSRNTLVIKSLLKCVAFCGKQGLSFEVTEMIQQLQIPITPETLFSLCSFVLKMMMCYVHTWKQCQGMLSIHQKPFKMKCYPL